MSPSSPSRRTQTLRVFFACSLAFNILITPIAALASTYKRLEVRGQKLEKGNSPTETDVAKSAAADVFAKPLEDLAKPMVPAAVPAPAPLPAAPPVGSVTSSLTASLLAANGGIDADSDGKADPGDTIAYTLSLANSSGAGATGLAIANPLDSHTTIVGGSLNSTPVAFDQSVSLSEDATLVITLTGQDPDGSSVIFKQANAAHTVFTNFPANPTTIATAHGTIGNFGSVTCDANGVCSQQVTYTPAANYNGPDSFTFVANDATANSNENGVVTITVNPVNDAPTFTVPSNPAAVNEDAGVTTVSSFITGVRPAQGPPTINSTEDTQTVDFVVTNVTHSALFTAGGQPVLNVSNGGNQPFPLTANLVYTPAPNANGTAVVTYHLHDNGGTANSGVNISADQTFTITVNAVNDAPVVDPVAKAFTVQANMRSVGFTGLLANATDPDATNANADALSADAAAGYTSPTFTLAGITGACESIVANPATGAGPCKITITSTSTGTFTFDPPPGVTGAVTLNYTISDNGNPGSATSLAGTINITINGPVIWFVDPTRTNNGNGTLSGAADAAGNPGPFKTLAAANNAINLKTGQRVFVYTGTTPAGEALDLSGNNNWLVGQGTVATNFDTFFGLTGGNAPPAATVGRPTLSSNTTNAFNARPQISGTVTMRNDTQVTGVKIVTTGATAGLKSTGFSSGTSLVKDVSVTTATGNAVDFSGTQTITYETSDNTNSPNVLVAVGGIALTVSGSVTIGANGFTFKSISANGGANGIVLNNTGSTAGLTVTGTGSAGTGGTIQNCTQKGADFRTAKNISLSYMNFTNNATGNLGASGTCGDALNGTNGPTTCNANIAMSSVTTATLTNVTATGSKQIGIDVKGGSNLTLTNLTVTGNGNETMEDGVQITDLTGTLTVAGGLFKDNAANQFEVQNGVAGPLSVIVGTSTFSNTTFPTGATTPANTTSNSGLFLATHNSAVMNPTITNNVVDRIYAQGIRLDMAGSSSMTANIGPASGAGNGNNITNSNQAISVTGSNTGGLTYNIRNNTANITPAAVAGGATNQIGVARSTASGTWTGVIDNNTVGTAGTANSGCQVAGCDGIDVVNNSAGTHKLSIINNHIHDTEGSGMVIIAGGAPDNSTVSWTVQNNFIDNPDQNAGQANPAILIQSGTSVGTDTSKTCLNISGNTISGTWSLGTGHLSSIRVRSLTTAAGSFAIVGFNPATEYPNDPTGVAGSTTGAVGNVGNVADYIRQQNPAVTNASPGQNAASATQGAAVFSNSGGCPLLLAEGGVMAALNSPSLISSVFFSSFEMAPAGPTAVAPITTANAISASLTQPQLDALVDAAIQRWTLAGLNAEQIASVREIKFEVTDLTNAYLAESSGNRILVDRSAEGKGWFLDATPLDDSEFANALAATRRYTDPQSAPAGHIDLLTAIAHEMGHKLGLGDSYLERDRNNLMYGYLTVGERRLPEKGQAAQPTAGGAATSHYLALEPSRFSIAFGEVLAGAVGAGTEVFDKAEAEISGQWSMVSALTGSRSQESGAGNQRSEARGQRSDVRLNHARSNSKLKTENSRLASAATSALPPTPVGSFPINGTGAGQGFQLPDGKTITITFKATLNAPPNFASYSATQKVTAQATLTGSFIGNPLLSDDPSVVGTTDPTSTTVDLYDSTTSLSASPSNSTNTGQAVTFTATIGTSGTPNGSATNRTGTVNFRDNGATIGCDSQTVSHVGSNDVATCTTSGLSTGTHNNITAAYSGDGNFDPSTSAAFTQTVSKSGTNATLVSSLNPATVTQNITFTFTISSATSVPGPPTGTVTFKDGAGTISCSNAGGQILNGSGVATCQTSSLTATSHTITADYPGDTNFNANAGVALTASGGQNGNPQVVNKATPSVTLVSSLNPAFIGQTVTFTATVAAPGGISAAPTGTLTFKDGGVAMTCTGGTQSLSGGVATCQKNNLTSGSHTITVDYPTDANFNAVSGTAMTAGGGQNGNPQVINQSNTTMTVASSLNPSKVSESVKFTLNIKSSNLAQVPGPPTGNVKFWDGPANTGTLIGVMKTLGTSGCLDAQSACVDSDTTTSLTAGTHTITVEYLGDANFTANNANLSGGQVVNKSDTTTTITSDAPDMSNVGQSVSIVAHVVSTGVTFTNTGTVLFKEGANTISGCAAQPINGSGDATCTTSALPAGTLSLTAVYSGDATFNTSTSAAEPHQVGPTCANSIVVSDNGDSGLNTLRQAMLDICDGGTITFAPAVTSITLLTELHFTTKNMTITGPGSGILTISGGNATRVFDVDAPRTITISALTISAGKFLGGTGAPGFGGGVLNAGNLTLSNVTLSGNQAIGGVGGAGAVGGDGQGGAIFNSGTLALNTSLVSGNTATGGNGGDSNAANGNGGNAFGGGVYNTGTLNLTNTTVSTNNSNGGAAGSGSGTAGVVGSGLGGGIHNDATGSPDTVTISNSTINGNNASTNGGGIANVGSALSNATLSITNSTISGNRANNDGGGLFNDSFNGTTTITASTVTDNHADNDSSLAGTGGGIRVVSGPVILKDTIVANNYQASLQVETATVTGGPITPGVAQVETLTVVMTSPPITTSGSGTLKVTIGGTTLPDKPIPLVNGDNEASVAIKIRDLLNADATVHGPFTATVGTGGNTADVILTRNSPAANDGTLNLAVVGCGTSPCTGLNSAPTSANTTPGVAGSAGTQQVETATVVGTITGINQVETATVTTNGGANGAMTAGGTFNVTVTAAGMTNSPKDVPVTVGAVDESGVATAIRAALTADADVGDVTTGFFTVSGSGASVVLTAKAKAANDTTMNIAIGACGACLTLDTSATSANTTAGVAAGIKQVETATVTTNAGANGAMTAGGTFNVTVTAVGMNGSPKGVPVTVGAVDESGVATAIRAALAADPDVGDVTTGFFTVSGSGASVVLTAKAKAANDTTMNIAIGACGACLTLDTSATSANTTAGDARGSANATVTVTAAGMNNSPKTLNVLVLADDDASAVAQKMRIALSGDPDITNAITGFTVSGATDKIILTKNTAAANDTSLNIATDNGTCAGLTPQPTSANTLAGVAPIAAVNQVETATVSITSSPISTNGNGIVRVTFNSTTLPDYNVPLLAGDNEAAVAIKIRDILNASPAFNGTYTASVGTGADTDKVILTANSPAANDTSLNLEIVGCGSSCPGLNSVPVSGNTTAGVAPGTGTAKVTVTADPGYFFNPTGTKDIFVPVLASDTAAQVAAKIRDFLNANDTDVNSVFMASASTDKVRLTRKVIAPDDPTLTISIDNGTSTGLTPSPTSENTRLGGGSVIHDDINGAIDGTSTFNLVGVSTGMTGISNGSGNNQVGTGGSPIDPKLDPLANNSGPTMTHRLQDLSPAIDKGSKFTLTTDQRGLQRPIDQPDGTYPNVDDGSDIGAFERQAATPVPVLTLTSVSTRDITPNFDASNLVIGATVELLRDGNPTSPATIVTASAATMALTDNTLTGDGSYSYTVRQTVAGDAATSTPAVAVTVGTAPSTPDLFTADDTFAVSSGGSDTDNITKINTPRFAGGAPTDPGVTIQLFANGNPTPIASGLSDGSGNWLITSSALAEGTYSITAREVIGSFVGGLSTALTGVRIDTSIVTPSTPVLLPADDSGALGDTVTNKTTPAFTGTAEANSAIQLFANGNPVGTGVTNGSGNWSVAPSGALSDGTYSMTVVATDVAGNVSAPSLGSNVTIDTQVAAPSTPDLINGDDSGAFNNDNYTNKTTPTFTGTAEAGSSVQLFAGATPVGTGTATGGNWSVASSALTDGTYQITAIATDTAGNISSASAALSVTIDTQVPPKPAAPDLVAADDTGAFNTDNITKATTPTFTGTAEASARIDLFKDSGGGPTLAGTGNADGLGNWTVISGALADGTYQMTVVATDLAGNQSVSSDSLSVTIDTAPPPAPLALALLPADDTGTSNSDGITKKNTPTFTGTAEASSIVQLFAGATPVGSGTAAGGNFSITSGLLADNSYNMTAQATDLAGNTGPASAPPVPITIDTVKPTVTMSSAVGNPTASTPIPVTVQFSESVTGFTLSDIVTANGTKGNFAGSNANYSFDLTPTAAGGVSADIAADMATDTAGNGNTAAVQFNRTFDPSALNATITPISPNPRNTAVASIQIVFNKAVTGFDLADLTLKLNNGANLLTGAQTLNSADNATWTLGNLAGITAAQGTYDLKLTAAGSNIKDSTNTVLASDATGSWVMDTTAPTVTVEQAVGQTDPATGPSGTTIINFTATFSKSVTGLTAGGVTISGTANPTIVNVSGSGTTYNLAVQGMNQSGTVIATINASQAQDAAGNGNAASTSVDNTVQFNKDDFTTLEVNTTADTDDGRCDALGTGSGNQDCTLREAINAANADFGAETITFNSTVFASPGPYTINLTGALPDLLTDMTINGPGAKVLTVKRNTGGNYRIFTILIGSNNVTIDGLTLSNGNATGLPNDSGGAILILASGTVNVTNSAISANTAGVGGGGIANAGSGTLNITNSTISGNSAVSGGGIIASLPVPVNITNSTISGNLATDFGGGIRTGATLTISNSTITNNRADNDNNGAGTGGGIYRDAGGSVTLQNTIVAGNFNDASPSTTADDINGTMNPASSFNLIGTGGAGGLIDLSTDPTPAHQNQVGVANAGLNPLADNGGPTLTHSLICTSPAIDKGFKFGLTTDQRGGSRPFDFADAVYPNAAGGDGSDIGAYETQSAGGCVPTAVPPSPAPSTNEDTPVVMTLTGTYSQNINLTFSITQNPTIGALGAISAPNCVFNLSMTCTATVTYTPNPNVNGVDLFKFKVSAGGLDSDPADVNVTINATNDPPTFLQAGPQTVPEDAGPQSVANFITVFSPGPPDESGQTVQFIVTGNTNPGLFSAAPAIDGAGTLTYTSASNANGSATITIVAKDNGGGTDTSAPQSFTITVLSVNDAPSFTVGPDQTVLEDAGQQVVNNFATGISVGPAQESAQTAQFIITNNTNPGMFTEGPVISPTGKLTYISAPDANGSATITVVLKDNGGTANGGQDTSAPQTFTINVTPVNDQPTLNPISNVTIDEDAATQTVNLAGINAGGSETQTLAITATSSNPSLIPNPTVTYASPNATGSLSFKPLADANGFATITVTLKDDGGTSNGGLDTVVRTFVVQVNPVNDAPINNVPGPQTVIENGTLVFASSNANQISISDIDAAGSQVKVTLTATNGVITLPNPASLAFSVGDGTADPTMTFVGSVVNINAGLQGLIFTPTNGFSGAASLQIITNDQGDHGSGGSLIDTDAVSITVSDGGALQFSAATYAVSENNGPAVITITRTGGSAGTATVQIATSNGTATAGSDYTAVSQTVTFGIGETSKTVNIPITDDLINEPDETVNLTLSNVGGSGALGSPLTAVLTITNDDPTGGYIKFSAPNYSVAEGGVTTITVQRVGTLTQAVTVDFATTDNSDPAAQVPCAPTPGNTLASSRCDFTSTFGRLSWAAGDGADKTFKVMTAQDNYVEGPETLTLTLSNLSPVAAFSGPSTETLTITDDAAEPATNPIDDSDAYVEQLYRDFLNRPSDPSGKAFWVNNINHCNDPAQRPPGQTAAQCIQIARIVTGGAFFLSNEFQATGGTAYLTNKASFGSLPNFARFERDAQQIGQGYVFGAPGAETLLEANKVAYFNDYVTRTEFVSTYNGVSNQQYVDTLISNTGVSFTPGERNQLVNGLNNQTETRATVLRKIIEKPAFKTAEFNSMFVLMEYYGFLRRNPDQAGFAFWLNKLNQANGDYFAAEMVKAFIESSEYRQRFGQ